MGLFSSAEKLPTLEDLLHHEIADLHSAESQLIEALPKMAEAATDSTLKSAFTEHLQETKGQRERLVRIGQVLNFDVEGTTCKAMKGLVAEGQEIIKSKAEPLVKDAGLIGAAQRVEHYEMAGYGTAMGLAKELGHQDVYALLEETLNEEKNADQKLNQIAINRVNKKAQHT
uniref:Ferritin-like domain-containing protein n=1 Tax=Roseihalotalea indica TaxID=2867963 RepID=A0AA49JJB2_9BACT|nr:ferritin-like domain-containing protein [Tunicatimonas sp. TK19036]